MYFVNEVYFLTCGFKCLKRNKRRNYAREGGILLSVVILLLSSSRKFKVEFSQTYLVLATRDLIYGILKTSGAWFQPKNTTYRFSKGQKKNIQTPAKTTVQYLAHLFTVLLWKNKHTHLPLWWDGNSPGEHVKWCGGGTFEKRLNEFISITICMGCLMCSYGSEWRRQPLLT